MSDHDETLANFTAITGATESQALQMLEATGYSLEQAVELYFAAGGDVGVSAGPAAPSLPAAFNAEPEDDEALAHRLQNETNAAAPMEGGLGQEDQVRAPLPSKVERLYGDFHQPGAARAARGHNAIPSNALDAFRDFSGDADVGGGAGGSGQSNRLASMFEPPRDLLFHGNFEEAKAYAASLGKWLIVNLQSTTQFASHQLNRDTWRDAGVHALVESSFVLFQAYDVTDEGQKLCTFYNAYEIPAILVLDPVTGAPMRHWTGFLTSERMSENLSPFLDTAFTDPGAARLAASMKRKQAGMAVAGAVMPSHGSNNGRTRAGAVAMDEDAELQAALEASMAGIGPSKAAEEEKEKATAAPPPAAAAPPAGPSPEEVAAEAAARLPDEVSGPEGCRIAVRFPDEGRQQRRFPRAAPLSTIHDWCLTVSLEAARGRPFFLSEAVPGAPALLDVDQSLEAAGVADAMLVMKWCD